MIFNVFFSIYFLNPSKSSQHTPQYPPKHSIFGKHLYCFYSNPFAWPFQREKLAGQPDGYQGECPSRKRLFRCRSRPCLSICALPGSREVQAWGGPAHSETKENVWQPRLTGLFDSLNEVIEGFSPFEKGLTDFVIEISFDKLTENCSKSIMNTSKNLPEAPPEKPEIATQTFQSASELSILGRKSSNTPQSNRQGGLFGPFKSLQRALKWC